MGWTEVKKPCSASDIEKINDRHEQLKRQLDGVVELMPRANNNRIYMIKSIDGHNYKLKSIAFGAEDTIDITQDLNHHGAQWSTNMTSTSDNYEDLGKTRVTGAILATDTTNNTIQLGTFEGDLLLPAATWERPSVGDIIHILDFVS